MQFVGKKSRKRYKMINHAFDFPSSAGGWNGPEWSHVVWRWGCVEAVTLLAPGRRWSLTYGSASPLESMAFRPCRHTDAHKVRNILSCQRWRHHALTALQQLTGSEKDSENVKPFQLQLFFFLQGSSLYFCVFLSSLCSSRELFSKIYIINTVTV